MPISVEKIERVGSRRRMPNFFDNSQYPVGRNVIRNTDDGPQSHNAADEFNRAEDLESIDQKVSSLMNTLNSIQDDITLHHVRRKREQAKLDNPGFGDYFRAMLMFFLCIGLPFGSIEIFSRSFSGL